MSTAAKVVLGCGAVCLVVAILAAVAVLLGVWWTLDPGEQVASRSILGPDCVAAVHYSGEGEGVGIVDLVEHVFEEAHRLQGERRQEELPEPLRWLERLQSQQRRSDVESLFMWIPREATLIVEEGEDEPEVLVAANFRALVRAVRALLLGIWRSQASQDNVSIVVHGEHEIVVLGGEAVMCFVGGTVLVGSNAAMIERSIDRLGSTNVEQVPSGDLARDIETMLERWPLAGAVDNGGGLLQQLLDRPPPACPPPAEAPPEGHVEEAETGGELQARLAGLSHFAFGARIASADRAEAEVVLDAVDGEEAVAWARFLGEELADFGQVVAEQGLELDHEIEVVGSRLTLTLEARGLEAAADRLLAKAFDES